jgi:hypothetical protein
MSQNEETQVMDDETDVHPIPKVVTPPLKPKRVLTEAQKLAFMRGREKRAANIQQRKQSKEEHPDVIPTTPPSSAKKPQTAEFDYDLLAAKLYDKFAVPVASPPKKRAYTRRVESPPQSTTRPPPPPPPAPARSVLPPPVKRVTTEFNWM